LIGAQGDTRERVTVRPYVYHISATIVSHLAPVSPLMTEG